MQLKEWMTRQEIGQLIGVSPHTVKVWESQGRIQGVRLGWRTLKYRGSDVERLMQPRGRRRFRVKDLPAVVEPVGRPVVTVAAPPPSRVELAEAIRKRG